MNFNLVLCHWHPNWWTNKIMSACIYARSSSTFYDVTLRVSFMPVAVTVRNVSSTHKSQQRICSVMLGWLKHEEYTRFWFCDFRNLGTGACGVVIGANIHRMNFCLAYTIAEWSTLLKQDIWMQCLHAFGINRHKCKADVSFFFFFFFFFFCRYRVRSCYDWEKHIKTS